MNYCIFKDKLTKVDDLLGLDLGLHVFICYSCEKQVYLNMDAGLLYHTDTDTDTDNDTDNICEPEDYEMVKKPLNLIHNIIKNEFKEVVVTNADTKYIIDGYISEHNMGIECITDKIAFEDIVSLNNIAETDWIINVENQFIRHVNVGNYVICEVPNNNLKEAVKIIDNNIFLYTGSETWIWLEKRANYTVEVDGQTKNVWIGEPCLFQDVLDNTCLQYIVNEEAVSKMIELTKMKECVRVDVVYARCEKSMRLLDDIHRNYITKCDFQQHIVTAIKSVAGSGKTTSLLNISKQYHNKRILYIAFNKSLITEIKEKLKQQNITNIQAYTFDALLYRLFSFLKGYNPHLNEMKPQTLSQLFPFFEGKPYKVKYYYCKRFIQFCSNHQYNDVKDFCMAMFGQHKPLLEKMWADAVEDKFVTFESIRKRAYINRWFNGFIDNAFDMVMCDETQDFDMIMLNMLLNDTKIPKLFVGDPKQSIYDFRGCINAFNYLPKSALIIEFYSTFRVGNPACETINAKFSDCWIISKSKNKTHFVSHFEATEKYVYLFRSWRILLQTAECMRNIWIYGFEKKINDIKILHNKLQFKDNLVDDEEYEDDLPKFLKTLTSEQLDRMLKNIMGNIVSFEDSRIKFYTVHSYKGMENDNVRLAGDINIKDDENIYYVAITRGMKKILVDGIM